MHRPPYPRCAVAPLVSAFGIAVGLGVAAAPASAEILLEYHFDESVPAFSGTDGWVSRYCTDP